MTQRVPESLGKHGLKLWKSTMTGARATPQDLVVLETACRLLDRIHDCREILAKEGLTSKGRFGQLVMHPALEIERYAMAEFRACLKLLGLADQIPKGKVEYR
jgi:P27 family predicted phage terminase small subunit